MNRSPLSWNSFGVNFRVHWSALAMPVLIAIYCLIFQTFLEAIFYSVLAIVAMWFVLLRSIVEILTAKKLKIKVRDYTLYPLWGNMRLGYISARPWQENYIAAVGLASLAIVAGVFAVFLRWVEIDSHLPNQIEEPFVRLFIVHLFWLNIWLIVLNVLPILPLDGGRIFRGSLAMSSNRDRATRISIWLSNVFIGLLFLFAILLLRSPLVVFIVFLLYISTHEVAGIDLYFSSVRESLENPATHSPMIVPLDRMNIKEAEPGEENFSGFIWDSQSRLWIQWKDGQLVSGHVVIGD